MAASARRRPHRALRGWTGGRAPPRPPPRPAPLRRTDLPGSGRAPHPPARRASRSAPCAPWPRDGAGAPGTPHCSCLRAESEGVPLRPTRRGPKPAAPAELDHAPARCLEPVADLAAARVRRNAIEALAIHVHDPKEIAEAGHVLLE